MISYRHKADGSRLATRINGSWSDVTILPQNESQTILSLAIDSVFGAIHVLYSDDKLPTHLAGCFNEGQLPTF